MIDRDIRDKIKSLCKELFNKPSLGYKLLKRGKFEGTSFAQAQQQGYHVSKNSKFSKQKHYTPETLLKMLEDIKTDQEKAKTEAVKS